MSRLSKKAICSIAPSTLAAVIAVVLMSGCASPSVPTSPADDAGSSPRWPAAFKFSQDANATTANFKIDRTIVDLLPNQEFVLWGGEPAPLVDGLVVGEITMVREGAAYAFNDDGTSKLLSDFDDSSAVWKIAVAELKVVDGFGKLAESSILQVGFTLSPDTKVKEFEAELVGLGDVIAALQIPEEEMYPFAPEAVTVLRNGALFGDISNGRIVLPNLPAEEVKQYLTVDTVDGLRVAASEEREIIEYVPSVD